MDSTTLDIQTVFGTTQAFLHRRAKNANLLQLIHGHHQDSQWPPYIAFTQSLLENGWDVLTHNSIRREADVEQIHLGKVKPEQIAQSNGIWFVPPISDEYVVARAVLDDVLGKHSSRYQRFAIAGHSLHAHLAYALAHESLRPNIDLVIALMPVINLSRQRDRKLRHLGAETVDDKRFDTGIASAHFDKERDRTSIMVYRSPFWTDYTLRISQDATLHAIEKWKGQSIVMSGEKDTTVGEEELNELLTASQNRSFTLSYSGAHRPTTDEAKDIGFKIVNFFERIG